MNHTLIIQIVACCILGGLYGAIQAYGRYIRKRKEFEQKELARWQAELERQASKNRKSQLH